MCFSSTCVLALGVFWVVLPFDKCRYLFCSVLPYNEGYIVLGMPVERCIKNKAFDHRLTNLLFFNLVRYEVQSTPMDKTPRNFHIV